MCTVHSRRCSTKQTNNISSTRANTPRQLKRGNNGYYCSHTVIVLRTHAAHVAGFKRHSLRGRTQAMPPDGPVSKGETQTSTARTHTNKQALAHGRPTSLPGAAGTQRSAASTNPAGRDRTCCWQGQIQAQKNPRTCPSKHTSRTRHKKSWARRGSAPSIASQTLK